MVVDCITYMEKSWDRIHTDNWNRVKTKGVKAPNNKGDKLLNWLKENPEHVYKPYMTYVFPLDFSHEASTVVFDQTYWGVESIYYNGHKDRVHKHARKRFLYCARSAELLRARNHH